jgi:glutamate formiminotransferase/glutamate formiminotransferase/formiminotetrahydrofolate cyclodeaminase
VLIGVPNVSEGRSAEAIDAIARAFAAPDGALLLDVHSDPDHHRSVYTVAAPPRKLAAALVAGARAALERVDLSADRGVHPHVGAVDVVPVVYLDDTERGAACAEALVAADRIGAQLSVPVFLYGVLGGGRERAQLRRGGVAELARRVAAGELAPDFGPPRIDARVGATLVAARPPLVAFNVELAPPATLETARAIAAAIREGGAFGLPGVRAIGIALQARGGVAQVSCNVEDQHAVPLARLVDAIGQRAAIAETELVGLAPAAAFDGFPPDVPVRNRRTIEEALDERR